MALIDLDEFYHHISIALILVTAFTWNEAFKHMFDSITFLKNRHFLYAIFITIIVTIMLNVINYAQMFTNKELDETSPAKQDKENKNNGINNIDMYSTYTSVME